MKVKITRVDKDLPLPEYHTKGAVAFDVLARVTTKIKPNSVGRVPVNIIVQIPKGYMLLLKDRSSTAMKKGLLCTIGFIDQDFCGSGDEILLQFYNFQKKSVTVERGERLGQAAFVPIKQASWIEVDSQRKPTRGGFGSTDDGQSVGKMIVIYGANNLGKSTQVELLETYLKKKGLNVKKIKYPIYDLEPTGPIINSVLRSGVKMSEKKLQKLFAQNRSDYEETLKSYLDKGIYVIAEDYTGTGISWGMTWGVPLRELEKMNAKLMKEDLSIFLDGERFKKSIEKTHKNETDDNIWNKSRKVHQELAKRYGWIKINANQSKTKVQKDIQDILKKKRISNA